MNADEQRELQHVRASMRASLREQISILRNIIVNAGNQPPDLRDGFYLREAWGVATMTRENALRVFADDPETQAVIDELGPVIDELAKLIS
jgi:hypothetical protein